VGANVSKQSNILIDNARLQFWVGVPTQCVAALSHADVQTTQWFTCKININADAFTNP
jgi:hypothetical protein